LAKWALNSCSAGSGEKLDPEGMAGTEGALARAVAASSLRLRSSASFFACAALSAAKTRSLSALSFSSLSVSL